MSEKSNEFFEALRERVNSNPGIDLNGASAPLKGGFALGMGATIEALREMMVGEPIRTVIIHHRGPWGEPYTSIDGYHGTDGEEVIVLALRADGEKEKPKQDT